MSYLASKLKALKLELGEDLLVHLALDSLPAHFRQFKVSYNTQKDRWSPNELIYHCVQEEERQHKDKYESVHLKIKLRVLSAKEKKKKDEEFTYYFYKKFGHMKKECPRYVACRVKKVTNVAVIPLLIHEMDQVVKVEV
ncbi:hypothetical protein GmHk_09G025257 [Glycine max]|nr:hypothetical protein GmHk_09G025257 [Glycine max]